MEFDVKCKIAVFVCCAYFFSVHSAPLLGNRNSDFLIELTDKSSDKINGKTNSAKSIVKRSADWSRRISSSIIPRNSAHVAEESENVEVTSKPTRIIRRMRIHHGSPQLMQSQDVGEYTEIIPNSRAANGGGKIVRIKKFRRKPTVKATLEPETITTTPTITTTKKPYTVRPKVTPDTEYTHITVINKEVRNPKRNKKHKRKRPSNQLVPTAPYDSDAKQSGYMRVTQPPAQSSYPDYGGYYTGRRSAVPRSRQGESSSETELIKIQNNNPVIQENRIVYEPIRAYPSNVLKDNAPQRIPQPSSIRNQRLQVASTAKETLPNSRVKDVRISAENISTESPLNLNTVQASKDSPITDPTVSNQNLVALQVYDETANKTNVHNENPEPISYPRHSENKNVENPWPGQQRFPSRFPGFIYDEQDGFADPFFQPHPMHTSMDRSQQDEPLMTSNWRQPLSPFYSPNDPHRENYMFGHGPQSHQPGQLMSPGFHFSPQLTSLRRSILDTYEDGTTSEPVTHYTLPKFDIPSIDFNDKGCRTVYKEVKTLPGDEARANNENAKSFVMSRECFFPNGVPTTEEIRSYETTVAPVIEKA